MLLSCKTDGHWNMIFWVPVLYVQVRILFLPRRFAIGLSFSSCPARDRAFCRHGKPWHPLAMLVPVSCGHLFDVKSRASFSGGDCSVGLILLYCTRATRVLSRVSKSVQYNSEQKSYLDTLVENKRACLQEYVYVQSAIVPDSKLHVYAAYLSVYLCPELHVHVHYNLRVCIKL